MPEPVRPQLQARETPETALVVRVRRAAHVPVSILREEMLSERQSEETHGHGAPSDRGLNDQVS